MPHLQILTLPHYHSTIHPPLHHQLHPFLPPSSPPSPSFSTTTHHSLSPPPESGKISPQQIFFISPFFNWYHKLISRYVLTIKPAHITMFYLSRSTGINKPSGFIPSMFHHCLNMYHVHLLWKIKNKNKK